jgi:hypothetical protein
MGIRDDNGAGSRDRLGFLLFRRTKPYQRVGGEMKLKKPKKPLNGASQ